MKQHVSIPVIGNGNIFSKDDADRMRRLSLVDGVMVSRGALGNPWAFREIKGTNPTVSLDEWYETVSDHLKWQEEAYGERGIGAICMRKHLLWYTKGWVGGKKAREAINKTENIESAREVARQFYEFLKTKQTERNSVSPEGSDRFGWDPKYEMDRKLDRGVFDDKVVALNTGSGDSIRA